MIHSRVVLEYPSFYTGIFLFLKIIVVVVVVIGVLCTHVGVHLHIGVHMSWPTGGNRRITSESWFSPSTMSSGD